MVIEAESTQRGRDLGICGRDVIPPRRDCVRVPDGEDAALRQRVDETRQVVAMMRAMPLRSPKYLITPSMVTQARPSPAPRRVPLFAMRLATSLVALAFVGRWGWRCCRRHDAGDGTGAKRGAAEALLEFVASTVEVEAEVAALEAPAPAEDEMAAEGRRSRGDALAQGTLTPEEELALEPMPAEGEATGMGGGGEAPVAAPVDPRRRAALAAVRKRKRTRRCARPRARRRRRPRHPQEEVAIAATDIADTEGAMAVAEAEEEVAGEGQPLAMPPAPDGDVNVAEGPRAASRHWTWRTPSGLRTRRAGRWSGSRRRSPGQRPGGRSGWAWQRRCWRPLPWMSRHRRG